LTPGWVRPLIVLLALLVAAEVKNRYFYTILL